MGKIGFIDLVKGAGNSLTGSVYVFNGRAGTYTFEKVIKYDGFDASSLNSPGVGEYILSLPVELLNFRVLKLPFSDREKLLRVIPLELSNLLMGSAENVVFDAVVLGGSGDAFDVLVAYVEKNLLRETLDRLSSRQIDPVAVTSIELRTIARGGAEDIALRLLHPGELTPEERISAAGAELSARTINLRTGSFAYTKGMEKVKKTLRLTAVLSTALALFVHAYLAFGTVTAKHEASSLKRELRNMYSGLFPNERTVADEVYQMKSHMKAIKEKGDAMIGVYPLQFLLDLSQKTSTGIAFAEISLDRDLITMKGEASSMSDIDKVRTGLSGVIMDVSVSDIKPSAGGKTLFTIVAKGKR